MSETSLGYPKELRLRRRAEISRVLDDGRASVGKCVVAKVRPNELGHARLGLVVSRKYGNAIKRNRMKRRMREVFRLNQHALGAFDIVLIPRNAPKEVVFAVFKADMLAQIAMACAKPKRGQEEQDD